jgi:tetratricopeptide (TPR) repeat protein
MHFSIFRFYVVFSLMVLWTPFIFAQIKALRGNSTLKIIYKNTNKSKNQKIAESLNLLIRDKKIGTFAKLEIIETTPSSGVFTGEFKILWADSDVFSPEVYILDQASAKIRFDDSKEITKALAEKDLQRLFYFVRPYNRNTKILSLFDSPGMAADAFQKYLKNPKNQDIIDPSLILQSQKLGQDSLIENISKSLQDQELIKLQGFKNLFDKLNSKEKAESAQKAKDLAAEGTKKYLAADYPEAVRLFEQAIELAPYENSFLTPYGISLYRQNQFQKSIAILGLVEPTTSEVEFFMGLNKFKLGAYTSGLGHFQKSKKTIQTH